MCRMTFSLVLKEHFIKNKTKQNKTNPVLLAATHQHSNDAGSDLGSTELLKMYFKWQ